MAHTEFQFPCPDGFRRVGNEVSGEVSLDATDHVVVCGFTAFTDDAEGVVLHDGRAADAA